MNKEVQPIENSLIETREIEARLIELRGQKVLIDRDVAALYGVETRRVNEAVKNNLDKFPQGYFFMLQKTEKQYLVENHRKGIIYVGHDTEESTCYRRHHSHH